MLLLECLPLRLFLSFEVFALEQLQNVLFHVNKIIIAKSYKDSVNTPKEDARLINIYESVMFVAEIFIANVRLNRKGELVGLFTFCQAA